MMRLSHPFIAELKRCVANQKSKLSPIIMSISQIIIKTTQNNLNPTKEKEIYEKQKKLSEVTDMIHAAYDFHRCVQDDNHSPAVKRDNVMSLLVGDYLLAQSSVDLAEIRHPETVGLIARGLEDYTRGEFLTLNSTKDSTTDIDFDFYAELTCGSLLANACQSVTLLAGEGKSELAKLVYNFGLNTGAAHRLMECRNKPIPKSNFVGAERESHFKKLVKNRFDRAVEFLLKLPDVEERLNLLNNLKETYNTDQKGC